MIGTIGGSELYEVWERAKKMHNENPYSDKLCEVCMERPATSNTCGHYICGAVSCNRDVTDLNKKN